MSVRSLAPTGFVHPREDIGKAIAYTCASVILGSLLNVGLKWLSDSYPAVELTFLRCLFGFVPVLFVVRGAGGMRTLQTRRPS
ncbi:MAG: hypothetical protein ACREFI_17235, partial [Stellaceae bacterium]